MSAGLAPAGLAEVGLARAQLRVERQLASVAKHRHPHPVADALARDELQKLFFDGTSHSHQFMQIKNPDRTNQDAAMCA